MHEHAVRPGASWDWFTNFGHYMRRIDCLSTPEGRPDWLWIGLIIAFTSGVIVAYLKIYHFWLRTYYAEERRFRNPKMLGLANVFLFCAITGYVIDRKSVV